MTSNLDVGVALGGGGIKGLAHLGVLRQLDQLDIRPTKIAGTSMGSIIGALYAGGLKATEIEERIKSHLFDRSESIKDLYKKRDKLINWLKFFSLEKTRGGILAVDGLFQHLFSELSGLTFSDLKIPLTIVATDFYTGKEYTFEDGEIVPALKASIAVPGVFAPQKMNDTLLVDGGLVNNLPINHIQDCDIRLASEVICLPQKNKKLKTSELLNGALNIMLRKITENALQVQPCDILFQADTHEIGAFDIGKIDLAISRGHEEATSKSHTLKALLKP